MHVNGMIYNFHGGKLSYVQSKFIYITNTCLMTYPAIGTRYRGYLFVEKLPFIRYAGSLTPYFYKYLSFFLNVINIRIRRLEYHKKLGVQIDLYVSCWIVTEVYLYNMKWLRCFRFIFGMTRNAAVTLLKIIYII